MEPTLQEKHASTKPPTRHGSSWDFPAPKFGATSITSPIMPSPTPTNVAQVGWVPRVLSRLNLNIAQSRKNMNSGPSETTRVDTPDGIFCSDPDTRPLPPRRSNPPIRELSIHWRRV